VDFDLCTFVSYKNGLQKIVFGEFEIKKELSKMTKRNTHILRLFVNVYRSLPEGIDYPMEH
jgi:hypothetical protein